MINLTTPISHCFNYTYIVLSKVHLTNKSLSFLYKLNNNDYHYHKYHKTVSGGAMGFIVNAGLERADPTIEIFSEQSGDVLLSLDASAVANLLEQGKSLCLNSSSNIACSSRYVFIPGYL